MKNCNKKAYNKKSEAILVLKAIFKKSGKPPWRSEMTYYECDDCGKYHLASLNGIGSNTIKIAEGKSYFDIQKERWGEFLHSHSAKKGNIGNKYKRNKK